MNNYNERRLICCWVFFISCITFFVASIAILIAACASFAAVGGSEFPAIAANFTLAASVAARAVMRSVLDCASDASAAVVFFPAVFRFPPGYIMPL